MTQKEIFELCDKVRETSFALHKFLRHGHKEKIYENGLCHRLQKQGIKATQQPSLTVYDEDSTPLGDLDMDVVVEDELVLELKAAKTILNEHIAQLLGYLRASRKEHGRSATSVPPNSKSANSFSPKNFHPNSFFASSVPFCGKSNLTNLRFFAATQ